MTQFDTNQLAHGSILGVFEYDSLFKIIICRHYNKIIPAWSDERNIDGYGYVAARKIDLDFDTLFYFHYALEYSMVIKIIME